MPVPARLFLYIADDVRDPRLITPIYALLRVARQNLCWLTMISKPCFSRVELLAMLYHGSLNPTSAFFTLYIMSPIILIAPEQQQK